MILLFDVTFFLLIYSKLTFAENHPRHFNGQSHDAALKYLFPCIKYDRHTNSMHHSMQRFMPTNFHTDEKFFSPLLILVCCACVFPC